jgi:mono/diheme cytochrome c family protein
MKQSVTVLLIVLTLPLILLACGRSQSASAPTDKSFLDATPLSTHVFQQPTTIIKEVAAKETDTPAPVQAADLSRGERSYTAKGCADCHGAKGEGVEGKGKKLAGITLSEQEFEDLLRTGEQGKLGNSHLFGVQAISPSGMKVLYAYVKSFQP